MEKIRSTKPEARTDPRTGHTDRQRSIITKETQKDLGYYPSIKAGQVHLHDCSDYFRLEHFAGWGLHPLESAAFSRRTP
jgi:hypothetical protein